jgi:hypothetical protein
MVRKQEKSEHLDQGFKASNGIKSLLGYRNVRKTVQILFVVCLILFAFTFNLSRAVRADYNHDEDQFIASVRLLLDDGLLPYRDYPYFHTPYLILFMLRCFLDQQFQFADRAYIFSSLLLRVLYLFWGWSSIFRNHALKFRYLAASIVFLYLSNPLSHCSQL